MITDMDIEYLAVVSRWIHIVSVIIAIGGTFFMSVVLIPAAEMALTQEAHHSLGPLVQMRWARVVQICIALIIMTGVYNAFVSVPMHPAREHGQWLYHAVLGTKILFALVLFFIASALVGHSPALEGMRRHRTTWLAVNLVLAAIIVFLSSLLKNIPTVEITDEHAAAFSAPVPAAWVHSAQWLA